MASFAAMSRLSTALFVVDVTSIGPAGLSASCIAAMLEVRNVLPLPGGAVIIDSGLVSAMFAAWDCFLSIFFILVCWSLVSLSSVYRFSMYLGVPFGFFSRI